MSTRFSVDFGDLTKKVNFIRNALGTSKTDIQVNLVRFDVVGSKLTMFASSKETFCRAEMKIIREEGATDGSFAVLGQKLEKLTSQVAAESATFTADDENLEVQAGFLTVNFEIYDGASLRTVEAGVQEHLKAEGLVVDRAALEEALACGKTCTTTNSIRPDVTHVELREGRCLASDGRKILIYTHDGFPKESALKVPAASINSVLTAVKNIAHEKVQLFELGSYYFLKANLNEFSMGIRKVERNFPAVEGQIVNLEQPTDEVAVDKNVLETILRGVALGLPSEEVKVTVTVAGVAKEAYLEVSAMNAIGRKSHERASCGRKSEAALNLPVSFKHLLDTLSVFKGDSVVDLVILQAKNLMIVRDVTDLREVLTVIPFRTDSQIEAERKEADQIAAARKKAAEEADSATANEGAEAAAAAVVGDELD